MNQKKPAMLDRAKVWYGLCSRLNTVRMNSKRGRQAVNRYQRSMRGY